MMTIPPSKQRQWWHALGLILSVAILVWLPQFEIIQRLPSYNQNPEAYVARNMRQADYLEEQVSLQIRDDHNRDRGAPAENQNNADTTTISSLSSDSTNDSVINNVLLMGQFNYDNGDPEESYKNILAWKSIWSRYFVADNILVAGPFQNRTQALLQNANITYLLGRNDNGYVSPLENLARAIETVDQYENTIQAVLYLHDDALLNFTRIFDTRGKLPIHQIMGTFEWDFFYNLQPERHTTSKDKIHAHDKSKQFYQMQVTYDKNSSMAPTIRYFDSNGREHSSQLGLVQNSTLDTWMHQRLCMIPQERLLQNEPEFVQRYGTPVDGALPNSTSSYMIDFVGHGQSDILLVPTNNQPWLDEFLAMAKLFAKYDMFLECSFPNLVYQVMKGQLEKQQKQQQQVELAAASSTARRGMELSSSSSSSPVRTLDLCTSWDYDYLRGRIKMISQCWKDSKKTRRRGFDMVHPFKLNVRGVGTYEKWLHRIQRPVLKKYKS